MNRLLIERALIFVAGAGFGFVGSGFFYKKKYEELLERSKKANYELEEYYKSKLEEKKEKKTIETDVEDGIDITLYKSSRPAETKGYTDNNPSNENDIQKVDYRQFYNPNDVNDALGRDEMSDDEERKKKGVQVISSDEYGEIPYYSTYELLYYTGNDALIIDGEEGEENLMQEVTTTLLEKIYESHFNKNEKKTMWIMHPKRAAYYMITKVEGTYAAE